MSDPAQRTTNISREIGNLEAELSSKHPDGIPVLKLAKFYDRFLLSYIDYVDNQLTHIIYLMERKKFSSSEESFKKVSSSIEVKLASIRKSLSKCIKSSKAISADGDGNAKVQPLDEIYKLQNEVMGKKNKMSQIQSVIYYNNLEFYYDSFVSRNLNNVIKLAAAKERDDNFLYTDLLRSVFDLLNHRVIHIRAELKRIFNPKLSISTTPAKSKICRDFCQLEMDILEKTGRINIPQAVLFYDRILAFVGELLDYEFDFYSNLLRKDHHFRDLKVMKRFFEIFQIEVDNFRSKLISIFEPKASETKVTPFELEVSESKVAPPEVQVTTEIFDLEKEISQKKPSANTPQVLYFYDRLISWYMKFNNCQTRYLTSFSTPGLTGSHLFIIEVYNLIKHKVKSMQDELYNIYISDSGTQSASGSNSESPALRNSYDYSALAAIYLLRDKLLGVLNGIAALEAATYYDRLIALSSRLVEHQSLQMTIDRSEDEYTTTERSLQIVGEVFEEHGITYMRTILHKINYEKKDHGLGPCYSFCQLELEIVRKKGRISREEGIQFYDRLLLLYHEFAEHQLRIMFRYVSYGQRYEATDPLMYIFNLFYCNVNSVRGKLLKVFDPTVITVEQNPGVRICRELLDLQFEVVNHQDKISDVESAVYLDRLITLYLKYFKIQRKFLIDMLEKDNCFLVTSILLDIFDLFYHKVYFIHMMINQFTLRKRPEVDKEKFDELEATLLQKKDQLGIKKVVEYYNQLIYFFGEVFEREIVELVFLIDQKEKAQLLLTVPVSHLYDERVDVIQTTLREICDRFRYQTTTQNAVQQTEPEKPIAVDDKLDSLLKKRKFIMEMIESFQTECQYDPVQAELRLNHLNSIYDTFISNQIEIASCNVDSESENQVKLSREIHEKVISLQMKYKKMITEQN